MKFSMPNFFRLAVYVVMLLFISAPLSLAHAKPPNILLIMSDDVGITNISAYSDGLVG
jgi:arylsulfatase